MKRTLKRQNVRTLPRKSRAAVVALNAAPEAPVFAGTVDELVAQRRPAIPVHILRPERLRRQAASFVALFPGTVMYAIKSNPDDSFLRALFEEGVRTFDVASIAEVRRVRNAVPGGHLYFMNPIKSREAIREAYVVHGVSAFVLDSADELRKIVEETGNAGDLELFVRLALPKNDAAQDFSTKFGVRPDAAVALLREARAVSAKLGISFHVGTQCLEPGAYARAIRIAADVAAKAGVQLDAMDVGGGFPTLLDPAAPPPPLEAYMDAISAARRDCGLDGIDFLCEPGRCLSAPATSLVVRVEARKGDLLHINDGTYGSLFEAGPSIGLSYPARMIRPGGAASRKKQGFRLAGPTCDSVDMMNGPFILPADIREGDWIELDGLGAYGIASRTDFNGFGQSLTYRLL